nr:hypothetical protein [Propionibacteriales bacterium]
SNVLSYADQLAAGRVKPAPVPATCAQSQIDVVGTPTQGLVTYGKQRAVLSLTESARQVTVYACDATAEVLFRDGY